MPRPRLRVCEDAGGEGADGDYPGSTVDGQAARPSSHARDRHIRSCQTLSLECFACPEDFMPARQQTDPYRSLATIKIILAGVVVTAIGIVCLYFGGSDDHFWRTHEGLRSLADHLGAALVISVGLGAVWEFVGKRAFALEVLERAKLSTDVIQVGIKRIGMDYKTVPDWPELFRTVRHLDVFAAYAQTWRHTYLGELQQIASTQGKRIRVFLPDPDDVPTVTVLAIRFATTNDDLRGRIIRSKEEYESMRRPDGAKIEIYYVPGDHTFTFYVFDETAVITLYRHKRERSPDIPTMVVTAGGTLYSFLQEEIASILARGRTA